MDKGKLIAKIREEMASVSSRYGDTVGRTHIGRLAMTIGSAAPASIIIEVGKEKESHAIR